MPQMLLDALLARRCPGGWQCASDHIKSHNTIIANAFVRFHWIVRILPAYLFHVIDIVMRDSDVGQVSHIAQDTLFKESCLIPEEPYT